MSVEMQIETFDCVEVMGDRSHPEVQEEALDIIKELDLVGQNVDGKLNPFPQMSAEQMFVYRTLCPKSYHIQEYARSQIPLRVLQTLKTAKELDIFTSIEVWDVADSTIKDPVLVGRRDVGGQPPMTLTEMQNVMIRRPMFFVGPDFKYYLLARWGEVLDTYETLKGNAIMQVESLRNRHLRRVKQHIDSMLDTDCELDDLMTENGMQKAFPELKFEY